MNAITTFTSIPDEMVLPIFYNLRRGDLEIIARTCKNFNKLMKDESLWKAKTLTEFGSLVKEKKAEITWMKTYMLLAEKVAKISALITIRLSDGLEKTYDIGWFNTLNSEVGQKVKFRPREFNELKNRFENFYPNDSFEVIKIDLEVDESENQESLELEKPRKINCLTIRSKNSDLYTYGIESFNVTSAKVCQLVKFKAKVIKELDLKNNIVNFHEDDDYEVVKISYQKVESDIETDLEEFVHEN